MIEQNTQRTQVYSYFNSENATNSYLLWKKYTREAIIIDPLRVDTSLFDILQCNDLVLSAAFFTHIHAHSSTLRTIPNIYPDICFHGGDTADFAGQYSAAAHHASGTEDRADARDRARGSNVLVDLKEHDPVVVDGFKVEAFFLPGHFNDSLVYRIENFLFTGDLLQSGDVVSTEDTYCTELLLHGIASTLFALPDDTLVFPLSGPPSTIGIEKECNIAFTQS